jgi:PAS domain S-box-containing protein
MTDTKVMSKCAARILICEDEIVLAMDLADTLKELGYEVWKAVSTGEECVTIAGETKLDLILMDIKLKGEMDGIEAGEIIHARFDIPIIYLTAFTDEGLVERARQTKPYGYLVKPYRSEELRTNIEMALFKHRMERELQQSEQKYRELVEQANSIILKMDSQGRITFLNELGRQFFGYAEEDVLGRPIAGTLVPETGSKGLDAASLTRDLLGNPEKQSTGESECFRKDGIRTWISWSHKAVLNEDGSLVEILSVGTDVTARKKLEEELRQSEERRRLALDVSKAGTWEWNPTTNGSVWSEELWGLFGLAPYSCEPSYEAWLQTIDSKDRASADQAVQEAASCGAELIAEWRIRGNEAGPRWLMARGRPVLDENGQVAHYIGIIIDITDRKKIQEDLQSETLRCNKLEEDLRSQQFELEKQNEELRRIELALRESRDKYADLYDFAPVGYITLNDRGIIKEVNLAATKFLGRSGREITGKPFPAFLSKEDADNFYFCFREILESQGSGSCEVQVPKEDGPSVHVRLDGIAVRDEKGRFTECRIALTDISRRKRDEAEIKALNKDLEKKVSERTAELARSNQELVAERESLRRTSRALRALSACSRALITTLDEIDLFGQICRLLVDVGGYRMAWVGFACEDEERTVRPVAHAGFEEGYLEAIKVTWADGEEGRGPTGTAIRIKKPQISRNSMSDPSYQPWRLEAMKRGYASSIALPLIADEQAIGALSIYARDPDAFDSEEVALLTQLADYIGYGVHALRTRLEKERAQEAVTIERRRLYEVLDTLPVYVCLLDSDYRMPFANRLFRDSFGHSEEKRCFEFLFGKREPCATCETYTVMKTRVPHRWYWTGPNGREYHIHDLPFIDNDGSLLVLEMGIDITEQRHAEREVMAKIKEIEDLYDNAPCGYHSLDKDGIFLRVNQTELSWLGYTKDELIGKKSFADLLHDLSREHFEQSFPEFKKHGCAKDLEFQMVRKDGTTFPVLLNATAIKGPDGHYLMSRSTVFDITERKQAEAALAEREQFLKTVVENIPDMIVVKDARDLSLVSVNKAAEDLLGYSREEMIGRNDYHFFSKAEADLIVATDRETMASGVMKDIPEKTLRTKDKRVRILHTKKIPVQDETGAPRYIVGISEDITERVKAAESLKLLATVVEHAGDAIVVTDTEGNIGYVNPAFERSSGYSSDEVVGGNARILKSGMQDDDFYRDLWETIAAGRVWRGHFINKKKDNSLFEEEAAISPIRNAEGSILNYVAIKRDVTKEMSLQRQLSQSQKMEAVGTLAGGVAHDFNNILQVALGYSELMLDEEDLPAHLRPDINKIYESVRRGADLVQRLLTFSRKAEIKPVPLNLNHRIKEMRKIIERTIPKMIEIRLLLADNPARINADPTQIDQVLMNLTVNARDAMPEGGALTFETADISLDEEYASTNIEATRGRYVLLRVSDTGSGMDKETLKHIFEPFYTTKSVGAGTGLGLAMVHGIVKQHGGHISCSSEPGHGTTFSVYLPALISDGEEAQAQVTAMPRGGSETILLVDDEEDVRDLGSRILTKAGYKVIEASDGEEALHIYQEKGDEISLVLLDLVMPKMGGRQCLDGLLKLNSSVKVVMASGVAADGFAKEEPLTGAKGFVNKPFGIRQMLSVLREVLDEE